jgi:dTDP-glucose pyrophosphorylase
MAYKLVLTELTTLEQAIALLDATGIGFLPVVNNEDKLVGIFTDGDLRKGLLKHENSVHKIINPTPITASIHESRNAIIQRLRQLKRGHMPIVDDEGKFIDVVVLNDFTTRQHTNMVVVMAGGLGSRLGELTRDTPKPMLLINGQPILKHIIENFKRAGFHQFVFCLNHKASIIQDYFNDGSELGVSINYTMEKKRLGTAGALSLLKKEKLQEPFIVTNADIITSLSYSNLMDFHSQQKAMATMCAKQYTMQLPYANIVIDEHENLIDLVEKPAVPFYVNAGIYVLNPPVLEQIPYNEYLDMPTLFHVLKKSDQSLKVFRMDADWIDVGLPQDFYAVNNK